MARIAKLERVAKVLAAIRQKARQIGPDVSVAVGYTAKYALFVHENRSIWPPGMRLAGKPRPYRRGKGRGLYWDPQGRAQPKFLEEPARRYAKELAKIVRTAVMQGMNLTQAMLLAGLRLQRESQLLVPVDTGNLKASAFTRLD